MAFCSKILISLFDKTGFIYDNLDGWLCKAKPELRSLIVEEMGRENALRQFSNKFQHIDLCKVLKNVHALEDYVSDDEESTEIIENTLIENDVPQIPEIQHVLTRKLNECLKVLKIDKFFAVTRLLSGKATPEERIEFIDEIIHDKEKFAFENLVGIDEIINTSVFSIN